MEDKKTQEKKESQTIEAKHIFFDIVNYTKNRSVEAQSDLIHIINCIVKEVIKEKELKIGQYIFTPTGDGMCISIINVLSPYNIHMQIALAILEKLYIHNKYEQDKMRQFQLRIGLNENTDNLITDINGNQNISGSGINIASRLESLGDNNQIIIGNAVYEKLVQREKYMQSFRSYDTEVKHGLPLTVHQFINDDLEYLNNEVPSRFAPETKKEFTLTTFQGYYIANGIKYESFIAGNINHPQAPYTLIVLLHQLAIDCIAKSDIRKSRPRATIKVERSIKEQFEYLQSIDFWVIADFSNFIQIKLPDKYITDILEDFIFVTKEGKTQLIKDHPSICREFGIS